MANAAVCKTDVSRFDSESHLQNSPLATLPGRALYGCQGLVSAEGQAKGMAGGSMGSHVPRQATDPCKIGEVGSIPTGSTSNRGGVAQSGERLAGSQKAPGAAPGTSTRYDWYGTRWYRRRHDRSTSREVSTSSDRERTQPTGGPACCFTRAPSSPDWGRKGATWSWRVLEPGPTYGLMVKSESHDPRTVECSEQSRVSPPATGSRMAEWNTLP